jgi:hypothetical protein
VNKQKAVLIKKLISYDGSSAEHKRVFKKLKKKYNSLPETEKVKLLQDIESTFKG